MSEQVLELPEPKKTPVKHSKDGHTLVFSELQMFIGDGYRLP